MQLKTILKYQYLNKILKTKNNKCWEVCGVGGTCYTMGFEKLTLTAKAEYMHGIMI